MFERYFDEPLCRIIAETDGKIKEIRIREGKEVKILSGDKFLKTGIKADKNYVSDIFSRLVSNSAYAYKNSIQRGFLTVEKGCRVGICGRCVLRDGEIVNISDISSINFRVANDIKKCGYKVINKIRNKNTIIIGPPGCGKTTMLRDLARELSGDKNVCVIDERGELFPLNDSEFVFDTGENTDVLSNAVKSEGISMVLRAMNPDYIVFDEIDPKEDLKAVQTASGRGVNILTSFHGRCIDDLKRIMPWYGDIFDIAVIMSKSNYIGEVADVICLR